MRVLFGDWRATMFSWSPDGQKIAYGDDQGIWVADADSSDAQLIAGVRVIGPWGMVAHIVDVEWSPDGNRLAFIEDIGEGCFAGSSFVGVVDVDGSDRASDLCGQGIQFTATIDWAPDGRTLVCDTRPGRGSVLSVEPDGSNLTTLTEGSNPVWSPDGASILYQMGEPWFGQGELWSYDISSGTASLVSGDFDGWDLDWQPIQGSFWDDDSSVFEADIEWMAREGITRGCSPPANTKFCPNANVTRGQMAAFLVRALDLTDRLDDPFTDDDDSIFEADIEKLAAAGITKGCNPAEGNTKFCPDHKVTREQMAAFLVRALHYTDDGGGDLFLDDDESIFEHDIDRLATAGVTKGCNPPVNSQYCPTDYVTRGQMAAFLHRALG
jgi:hypothetical protein